MCVRFFSEVLKMWVCHDPGLGIYGTPDISFSRLRLYVLCSVSFIAFNSILITRHIF